MPTGWLVMPYDRLRCWLLFGSHTFAINPAGNDYAKTEELTLGGINARWVALDIQNNYGHSDWMSIGELQFDGNLVPEPSTLLLALLGLALLPRRRRR